MVRARRSNVEKWWYQISKDNYSMKCLTSPQQPPAAGSEETIKSMVIISLSLATFSLRTMMFPLVFLSSIRGRMRVLLFEPISLPSSNSADPISLVLIFLSSSQSTTSTFNCWTLSKTKSTTKDFEKSGLRLSQITSVSPILLLNC